MRPFAKPSFLRWTIAVVLCVVSASHYAVAASSVQDTSGTTASVAVGEDTVTNNIAAVKPNLPTGSFYSNKYVGMTYVGLPLLVSGFATQYYVAGQFKDLRDAYVPTFRHTYDDYLQYAPAAAMLVIKACGVKGRSSWGRMLVSDAFSAALMAVAVNGLKYSMQTMRPDGSTANSFPSGHTATAFMADAMFGKEVWWGGPWISGGGSVGATTGGRF